MTSILMPNIATLLKSEISRLAKKEVRKEIAPLRKTTAGYRREIAQLKRTLASLQRTTKQLAKPSAYSKQVADTGRPVRFVAKGLISLRKRLGLSADQMARLLGVSMQSVYNWERKKSVPRRNQVTAIVALRTMSKAQARARLESSQKRRSPTKGRRRTPTRKRAKQRAS